MKARISLAALGMLLLPAAALAAAPQNFQGLANQVAGFFGSATTDLIVLAIVIYFWGAASTLFNKGGKDREKLRSLLMWGILVIFFAVSIWGIVQILQSTVFGQGYDATNGTGGGSSGSNCSSLNCKFGTSQ